MEQPWRGEIPHCTAYQEAQRVDPCSLPYSSAGPEAKLPRRHGGFDGRGAVIVVAACGISILGSLGGREAREEMMGGRGRPQETTACSPGQESVSVYVIDVV